MASRNNFHTLLEFTLTEQYEEQYNYFVYEWLIVVEKDMYIRQSLSNRYIQSFKRRIFPNEKTFSNLL